MAGLPVIRSTCTIAGVLAAFTIPTNVKISDKVFVSHIKTLVNKFEAATSNDVILVTDEQLHVLEDIRAVAREALTPLQWLEHVMHPFVAFVVMPVFALANAGITFPTDFVDHLASPVTLGVTLGLLGGKVFGIIGICYILIQFQWASLPEQTGWGHLFGAAMLASVGFTMSLFIIGLAFSDDTLILQAKLGILMASLVGGAGGVMCSADGESRIARTWENPWLASLKWMNRRKSSQPKSFPTGIIGIQ